MSVMSPYEKGYADGYAACARVLAAPVPQPFSPKRTAKSRETIFKRRMKLGYNTGQWSEAETRALWEGYRLFGKDYRRVSDFVRTRDHRQVRLKLRKDISRGSAASR